MKRTTTVPPLVLATLLSSVGCATQSTAPAAPIAAPTAPVAARTAPEAAPTAAEAAGDTVVATFTGGSVTAGELEARAAGPLLAHRQRVFEVQSAILEGMIFDRLVAEEARKAGTSIDDFLSREVDALMRQPTDDQVADVLTHYRAELPQDDAEARSQVVSFLLRQERKARLDILRRRLFSAAAVRIALEPPRAVPPLRDSNPIVGPPDAAVTIVEFSDFQCPYCRGVQPVLDELQSRYAGRIRLVFKQLPLPIHPDARTAAAASLCAADQGQFWPFHRRLFEHQGGFDRDALLGLAADNGLDAARFAACLADPATQAEVDVDVEDAKALGIDGTPRFFINGRVVEGAQPIEVFTAVIDDELRRAGVESALP